MSTAGMQPCRAVAVAQLQDDMAALRDLLTSNEDELQGACGCTVQGFRTVTLPTVCIYCTAHLAVLYRLRHTPCLNVLLARVAPYRPRPPPPDVLPDVHCPHTPTPCTAQIVLPGRCTACTFQCTACTAGKLEAYLAGDAGLVESVAAELDAEDDEENEKYEAEGGAAGGIPHLADWLEQVGAGWGACLLAYNIRYVENHSAVHCWLGCKIATAPAAPVLVVSRGL